MAQSGFGKRRGFTLIELLVVLAIIGVLVALLLPAVLRVREAAKCLWCRSNLHNVILATIHAHDTHDRLPPLYGVYAGRPVPPSGSAITRPTDYYAASLFYHLYRTSSNSPHMTGFLPTSIS